MLDSKIKPNENISQIYENCGNGKYSDSFGYRIVGNASAEFAELPWSVLILHNYIQSTKLIYKCGGSLIHPRVILTAAHCLDKQNEGYLMVRAGEWNTKIEGEPLPHEDRLVESFSIHPEYNSGSLRNDVALLFLNEPFELANNVRTICLPNPNSWLDNVKCIASGWGKNAFKKGKHSVILKKIEIPVVPRDECLQLLRKTRLGKFFNLHKSFICAGGELNKDACKGDGGNPLVCPIPGQNGRYFQAGIVSWGIGCGHHKTPGVYVNVGLFMEWIEKEFDLRNIVKNSYKYR